MATNVQTLAVDAAPAVGVAAASRLMLRQGGRQTPLAERLDKVIAGYQRRSASLELTQGCMLISAATAEAVSAAATACAAQLSALSQPWDSLRLTGQKQGSGSVPEVLTLLPGSAVIEAGRQAGLLPPPSHRAQWLHALPLYLWSAFALGAFMFVGVDHLPGGDLSVAWRLACITLAGTALGVVQHWTRRRHEARLIGRCLEALHENVDRERTHAFAAALAAPALAALPKPSAIIVEDPARLDALSLDILTRMRRETGVATVGVVHWIVIVQEGQDDSAARALLGTPRSAAAVAPPDSSYVLLAA